MLFLPGLGETFHALEITDDARCVIHILASTPNARTMRSFIRMATLIAKCDQDIGAEIIAARASSNPNKVHILPWRKMLFQIQVQS
jgi:hypothetical protein